jgi:hypothetical protein
MAVAITPTSASLTTELKRDPSLRWGCGRTVDSSHVSTTRSRPKLIEARNKLQEGDQTVTPVRVYDSE